MQTVHPLIVHFPVAFIVVASFAELARAISQRPSLDVIRFLCWVSLVGVAAAYLSGIYEVDRLGIIEASAIQTALGQHSDAARVLLWVSPITVLVLELLVRASAQPTWLVWLFRSLLMLSLVLVVRIGLIGGELVYTHGVGTNLLPPQGPSLETP
jgi:uncharacterized membrane protein